MSNLVCVKRVDKGVFKKNEKSFNLETGIPDWMHRELRSAVQSLQMFLPYLFSHEKTKELSQIF